MKKIVRIGLLTSISSQSTREVFKNAILGKIAKFKVKFISKQDLSRAKKEAGRKKYLADNEELEKIYK